MVSCVSAPRDAAGSPNWYPRYGVRCVAISVRLRFLLVTAVGLLRC